MPLKGWEDYSIRKCNRRKEGKGLVGTGVAVRVKKNPRGGEVL